MSNVKVLAQGSIWNIEPLPEPEALQAALRVENPVKFVPTGTISVKIYFRPGEVPTEPDIQDLLPECFVDRVFVKDVLTVISVASEVQEAYGLNIYQEGANNE